MLKHGVPVGRFTFFPYFLSSSRFCLFQTAYARVCLCACIYFQNHTQGTWASFSFPLVRALPTL